MTNRYIELIESAHYLIEGNEEGFNPEYERGLAELIMMECGFTSDFVDNIIKDIHKGKASTVYKLKENLK